MWPAVRCVSPVPCEDMYMCLVQRVVRSVLSARLIFLSPAETQSVLALRACTCAFERGTARLYAYGRRRTELELGAARTNQCAAGARTVWPQTHAASKRCRHSFATTQMRLHHSDQVERKAEATEADTRRAESRHPPTQLQHHRRRRVVHRPRALCRVQVPRWAG